MSHKWYQLTIYCRTGEPHTIFLASIFANLAGYHFKQLERVHSDISDNTSAGVIRPADFDDLLRALETAFHNGGYITGNRNSYGTEQIEVAELFMFLHWVYAAGPERYEVTERPWEDVSLVSRYEGDT